VALPENVRTSELADLFALTPRRLQQLASDGVLPKTNRGWYKLVPSVRAYISTLQDAAKRKSGNKKALDAAILRKIDAEADVKELDVAERLGNLVPRRDVAELVRKPLEAVDAGLRNSPSRRAHDLAAKTGLTPAKAQRVLEEIMEDIRQDLRGLIEEDADSAVA
jgi:phage terminase Nu1 subunit (DNA packaging protein)